MAERPPALVDEAVAFRDHGIELALEPSGAFSFAPEHRLMVAGSRSSPRIRIGVQVAPVVGFLAGALQIRAELRDLLLELIARLAARRQVEARLGVNGAGTDVTHQRARVLELLGSDGEIENARMGVLHELTARSFGVHVQSALARRVRGNRDADRNASCQFAECGDGLVAIRELVIPHSAIERQVVFIEPV